MKTGLPEVLREDKVDRRERLDGELSGQPLVDLCAVLDDDPPHPGLQELLDWKLATPLSHRDDDPVWLRLLDLLVELCGVIHDVDHGAQGLGVERLPQQAGQRCRSQNEHALAQGGTLDDCVPDGPKQQDNPDREQET